MSIQRLSNNLWALLAAALVVQLWLIISGIVRGGLWDLNYVYQPWVESVLSGGPRLGIDAEWVYPFPAFIPMLLADLVAPGQLMVGWLVLLVPANLVAVGKLAGWGKICDRESQSDGFAASWFYITFLFLLGPVAIGRLESVTLVMAIFGISALQRSRISSSSLWFSLAMWIKVWPAALIVAFVAAGHDRPRIMLVASATSALMLIVGLLLGGDQHLFSFVAAQSARGIQIESPVAAWWLWQIVAGVPDTYIYDDPLILSYQVIGVGVDMVSRVLGILMVIAVGVTFVLGVMAARRGVSWQRVVALTALSCMLDLIVFNKVGSPQYMMWLAAPVLFGLLARVPYWRAPALSVLALAFATWMVFPISYSSIVAAKAGGIALLTLRNVGLVALFASSTWNLAVVGVEKRDR